MNWRPSPTRPPRPRRTRPRSVSKIPPRSGLMVIADRRRTCRVEGTIASVAAASHARATSMLNRHQPGAFASLPPIARPPAEDDRGVPGAVEGAGKDRPHLAGSAGNDDLHVGPPTLLHCGIVPVYW